MSGVFHTKSILVTGGTGSFGRAFVAFLLRTASPKKVIVFSRDELKQYHMQKEFSDPRLRFFIGDIRDLSRLERAFSGVDFVVHAAALKQVPAMEYNPLEAVKTNIIGSQNVIDAAINQGVRKVILLSTDKAVHPINLYGSTKLCAEKLCIAANSYAGGTTKFSVVRYGNVIGSRGSIVDVLRGQKQAPRVQITDERMTRFWIYYDQALRLVEYALSHMEGGEIFVPRLPSMRLVDVFDALVPGIPRDVVGLRPGEKIHELLYTEHEARRSYLMGDTFVILPEFNFWEPSSYEQYTLQGQKVTDEAPFASHTNTLWLTPEQLKNIIDHIISL